MKVFIAWSGAASEQVAELMCEWLPAVFPGMEPFMSTEESRKSQRWHDDTGARLESAEFALLCLTPANKNSAWMHFEAGAVSRMKRDCVSALLLDVQRNEIEAPLQPFQKTPLSKPGLWNLVQVLNDRSAAPIAFPFLKKSFDREYPAAQMCLDKLRDMVRAQGKPHRKRTLASARTSMAAAALASSARVPVRKELIARNLGEHLRQAREARGVSQERLSARARVDRTFISQIERGLRSPTVPMLCKLSNALAITASSILTRVEAGLRE